jgi:ribonucleoside-diphosphate reductase subunit M1
VHLVAAHPQMIIESSPLSTSLVAPILDEKTGKADADPELAAALLRNYERELEDAKLQCSLENKARLMCSG